MTQVSSKLWWLAVNGEPRGPISTEEVLAEIRSGQISPSSLVCYAEGGAWRSMSSYPEFATTIPAIRTPLPGGHLSEVFLSVAGWYELVGVPCLKFWMWILTLNLTSSYLEGTQPYQLQRSLGFGTDILLLLLMFAGCLAGVKLLRRQGDGITWTLFIIAGQWIVGIVAILLTVAIDLSAPSEARASTEMTTQEFVQFTAAIGPLLIACGVEVIGVVWLVCLRRFLPRAPY